MRRVLFGLGLALLFASPGYADIWLPRVFSEGAVLQRDVSLPVWGSAKPESKVTVELDGAKQSATADDQGRWKVSLPPHPAGGPFVLSVHEEGAATKPTEIQDLYYGEVWIASGQSNMHWTFSHRIQDSEKELDAANDPLLRQFTVKKGQAKEPASDVQGSWLGASRENLLIDGPNGCSAVGYFFARALRKELKVPVGIINSSVGGTPIQQWSPGGGLYNNMIAPLAPFAVRGAIWYQGEANVGGGGDAYVSLTKAQVEAWRKLWGQGDFPYYFVQLAPFRYSPRPRVTVTAEGLPAFWDGQNKIPSVVPKTDYIVVNDITESVTDIHPTNKQDVGARLAALALHHDYGRSDIVFSGPRFRAAKAEGEAIRIQFDHTAGGLKSRDGKPLSHFLIAGADKKFVPAEAEIDGETVVVRSSKVSKPVAVRFAWTEDALPNLMNKAGLPAGSFRTDDWKVNATKPAEPAAKPKAAVAK